MGPNDYRHNPFTDVSTAVQVTEVYKIPAVSPYTIQLNEVPVKSNPSTMTVKVLNVSGTSITTGTVFAEVAANPAANQFYPDYNTSADGNENWNTGKLLFSSANAGWLVQITYLAKGTLASVRANRYPDQWIDRGDGSDGDFWPTSAVTISGIKNYKSIIIPSGVTVTVSPWAKIKCQGVCYIAGLLHANGTGSPGGSLVSDEAGGNGNPGTMGLCGGAGGNGGGYGPSSRGAGGATYYRYPHLQVNALNIQNLLYDDLIICSGGGGGSGCRQYPAVASGSGGEGGGHIRIIAKTIIVSGGLQAVGIDGRRGKTRVYGGGGGGGGVVILIANEVVHNNKVSVSGGAAGGTDGQAGNGSPGSAGIFLYKELGWS